MVAGPPNPSAAALSALILASSITHVRPLSAVPSASAGASIGIRIGTRSSKLALAQARKFASALRDDARGRGRESISTDVVPIDAAGDQGSKAPTQSLPLAVSGVDFTGALDAAVLRGEVDVAVHSLKDIPPASRWKVSSLEGSEHLTIGACLGPREIPLDVLLSKNVSVDTLQLLPNGARVGSASIRRQAQLKAARPDLDIVNIRGNVDARLRALEKGEVDALILALAGLKRLGILHDGNEFVRKGDSGIMEGKQELRFYCNPIPIETILPGLGQGIVGVACRDDNTKILSLLKGVDDHNARIAATAERALLDAVQRISPWTGRPPVAGYMRPLENSTTTWMLDGLLATPDGARVLRVEESIESARCNVERAYNLGKVAGESLLKMAGDAFLDGYY